MCPTKWAQIAIIVIFIISIPLLLFVKPIIECVEVQWRVSSASRRYS
jgi:hypothetical protein